jgi:hypothetical protein
MIRRPSMEDLLRGREPFIVPGVEPPEPPTFRGFRFHRYMDDWYRPMRLWRWDYSDVLVWPPPIEYVPGNPILPPGGLESIMQEMPMWFMGTDCGGPDQGLVHYSEIDSWPDDVPTVESLPLTMFGLSPQLGETLRLRRLLDELIGWPLSAPVSGDDQSAVHPDTISTLVDLAREGRREDFVFLAGASGVASVDTEALWSGTRKRLGLP